MEHEYVFAVVLKGKGGSPDEAWKRAVNNLKSAPSECPDKWMIEDDMEGDDMSKNLAVCG